MDADDVLHATRAAFAARARAVADLVRAQPDSAAPIPGSEWMELCRTAGVRVVAIADRPGADGVLGDPDGTYRDWFAELGAGAILVRPDFYVYGSAVTDTRALVEEFSLGLGAALAEARGA